MLDARRTGNALLVVVLLATCLIYAPGYAGYWLGDDFNNLHRAYVWQVNGDTAWQLGRFFVSDPDGGAAFYRPLIITTLTLDYLLWGVHYAGWYAHNHFLHLANTLLVALIVRRIAAQAGADAGIATPLAAGLFGLSPLLAEGVYWLSARSDASVTLLSLLGLLTWIGSPGRNRARAAWLPILLVPALLFKESAALLPLQAGLLWLAVPALRERRRLFALIAAALIVGGFLAWRAYLFGNAWQVYVSTDASMIDSFVRLPNAIASIQPWLLGLLENHWLLLAYALTLAAALLAGAMQSRTRLPALALFAAGGGAIVATLLNLGTLISNGEGGRLLYSPLAWLAIGLGVLCARASTSSLGDQAQSSSMEARSTQANRLAAGLLAVSTVLGAGMLLPLLTEVLTVQSTLRQIVASLPELADRNDDGTLLILPDAAGPVVAARNGQSAFVLRPLQTEGLIDRVLPTLPGELSMRFGQYADGLLDQLTFAQLQHFDLSKRLPQAPQQRPRWPTDIACWSVDRAGLIAFPAPDDGDRTAWVEGVEDSVEANGCWRD